LGLIDGGTVDRGHRRPGKLEQRVERVRQRRDQPIGVVGPAVDDAVEVHPGAERPARAGDHQRTLARPLLLAHRLGQLIQQLHILGVDPPG
jgi:hypothetical protein